MQSAPESIHASLRTHFTSESSCLGKASLLCCVRKPSAVAHHSQKAEDSHECSERQIASSQRSLLSLHHRTQTGEELHICNECGRALTWTPGPARLQRTHTGGRPTNAVTVGNRLVSSHTPADAGHVTQEGNTDTEKMRKHLWRPFQHEITGIQERILTHAVNNERSSHSGYLLS